MRQRAGVQTRSAPRLARAAPPAPAASVSRETAPLLLSHPSPPAALLLPLAIGLAATVATQAMLSELAATGAGAASVNAPTAVVVASVLVSLATALVLESGQILALARRGLRRHPCPRPWPRTALWPWLAAQGSGWLTRLVARR